MTAPRRTRLGWSGCCTTTGTMTPSSWRAAIRPGSQAGLPTHAKHAAPAPAHLRAARPRPALRARRDEVLAVAEGRSDAQLLETQRDKTYSLSDRDIAGARRVSGSALLEDARGGRIAPPGRLLELHERPRPFEADDRLLRKRRLGFRFVLRAPRRGLHRRRRLRRLVDGVEPRRSSNGAQAMSIQPYRDRVDPGQGSNRRA